MDAGAQKTKQLSRRACYEAELARLKDSWPGVEGLKGEAYLDAQRTYSVEKRRIEQEYADVRRPGRPAKRRERPVSRVAGNGPMWARGLSLEITRAFMEEELDLSERVGTPAAGWAGMPEMVVAERLRGSGARAADLRLLLTFTAAMDRAREADRLWFAAERLYRAEPWTFQPESVVSRGLVELSDALRSHGVSQRHGPDAAAWRMLAESLADPARSSTIRRAVIDGRGDAVELLACLRATSSAGTDLFPLLRGPKIGPMWVRMLAYPGGAEIASLEGLPVAVDVQVRKVTEYLGVTDTGRLELEEIRPFVQRAWAEDVARHGAAGPSVLEGTPAAVDPALWFWAKWGCTRCEAAGRRLPINAVCVKSCRFPDRGAA
jgi:hypothetical protein